MKRTTTIIASALALLGMGACTKDGGNASGPDAGKTDSGQQEALLTVSVALPETQTKAVTPYTGSMPYETKVNDVQVLVFNESGWVTGYCRTGGTGKAELRTTAGRKDIWAVVNGPDLSGAVNMGSVTQGGASLGENSTDPSKGFVMAGNVTRDLKGGANEITVGVSRLLSRIVLQKVTDNLPKAYSSARVENVFLSNVIGSCFFTGSSNGAVWLNQMGRSTGATSSSQIIDGGSNKASAPDLTFKAIGQDLSNGGAWSPATPALLYCYGNPSTKDASGWVSPFTPRKTRMVVTVSVTGQRYYYPITLNTPERNKTYTVELTLTNLGSKDPDTPVDKGSVNVSISVAGWQAGASYDESI